MRLIDLARQVAADAITLKQQGGDTFFMRTTPVELLGTARAARAKEYVGHVHDHETLADVEFVALRLLPKLLRDTNEKE